MDERSSDYEAGDKTIQASVFPHYTPADSKNVRRVQAKNNLLLNERAENYLYNQENMKTKKNCEDFYPKYQPINEFSDSLDEYDVNSKIEENKKISRHKRAGGSNKNRPTIFRNKSQPDLISEYDITKRVIVDQIQSSKNQDILEFSYSKYANKYSLTK